MIWVTLRWGDDEYGRARPGMHSQPKALSLSLPRIEIYLSCTHRGRRLNLEMWSPTSFSADGSFHLLFQQDIPPMLLRTPPACPAAQPYGLYLLFQHSSGHPCGDSSVNHRCRGPDGRAMEEAKIGREKIPSRRISAIPLIFCLAPLGPTPHFGESSAWLSGPESRSGNLYSLQ